MKYLWDTDTCIYHLNGNAQIAAKIEQVGAKQICLTVLTIAELKFGAYNSSRVEANLQRIETLKQKITVLSRLNEPITTLFAQHKSALKKQGLLIGDFDLLIASFAIHHKLILVTNNTEHFQRIPAIRLENWIA